jgi:hypothetical protein
MAVPRIQDGGGGIWARGGGVVAQICRNMSRFIKVPTTSDTVRSSLFWYVTQRGVVVTDVSAFTCRSHLQESSSRSFWTA